MLTGALPDARELYVPPAKGWDVLVERPHVPLCQQLEALHLLGRRDGGGVKQEGEKPPARLCNRSSHPPHSYHGSHWGSRWKVKEGRK